MTDNDWLAYITAMRANNNHYWMEILELALRHAPRQTRGLLKRIRVNDLRISEATGRIADEDSGPEDRDAANPIFDSRNLGKS